MFASIVRHVKWTDDVSLLACILLGLRFWLKEVFYESVYFTYHDVDSIDCARDDKNKREFPQFLQQEKNRDKVC